MNDLIDHIGQSYDRDVTIAITDLLRNKDRYDSNVQLAQECRQWLNNNSKPTLGRLLVVGFLLNKGLVIMSHSHNDVAWGELIESRQLPMGTGVSEDSAHDSDLSSFEQELHALALQ